MTNSETAKIFKAFCDERRLEILAQLQQGEKYAGQLIGDMQIGQSTLSHHMKILCESGVVEARKDGTWTYYSISQKGSEQVKEIVDAITKLNGYSKRNIHDYKED